MLLICWHRSGRAQLDRLASRWSQAPPLPASLARPEALARGRPRSQHDQTW